MTPLLNECEKYEITRGQLKGVKWVEVFSLKVINIEKFFKSIFLNELRIKNLVFSSY